MFDSGQKILSVSILMKMSLVGLNSRLCIFRCEKYSETVYEALPDAGKYFLQLSNNIFKTAAFAKLKNW